MVNFTDQIYLAIRDAEGRDPSWRVTNVIVLPETWQAIAADLGDRSNMPPCHFHLDSREALPITEIRVRGVPVIANRHAGPGFTLEKSRVYRFRA